MFKRYPNAALGLLLILLLTAGIFQGRHLGRLRDAERFYRWILTASTQVRLTGDPSSAPQMFAELDFQDKAVFDQLVEQTEERLEDIELRQDDYDQHGNLFPKIVRYTSPSRIEESQDGGPVQGEQGTTALTSKEQVKRDRALWRLARGPEMAQLRQEFDALARQGKISGLGTQFSTGDMYMSFEDDQSASGQWRGSVSLANVFFGFRKMAANLLWLEVDKYYHKGYTQRMIPLMNTVVMLDPSFIDAYLVGAWQLSYNATAKLGDTPWDLRKYHPRHEYWIGPEGSKERFYFQGVEFLEDGILKNPRNYKLYFDLGFGVYEQKIDDHTKAVKYLGEATRLWHDVWVPRMLYLCMLRNHQFEDAIKGWEYYCSKYPESKSAVEVAPRFLKINRGRVLERDAERAQVSSRSATKLAELSRARSEELLENAKAAQDAQETQRLEAQAQEELTRAAELDAAAAAKLRESEQLFNQAHAIWEELLEQSGGQESAAVGRMARMEALDLAAQNRPEEAVAKLEKARMESEPFFWEALDIMIDIKKEAGIPLSLSERNYIGRKDLDHEYTALLPKSVDGALYRFSADAWSPARTVPEDVTPQPLTRDSRELYEVQYEHPEVAALFDQLEGSIVFRAGDSWYRYERELPASLKNPTARQAS